MDFSNLSECRFTPQAAQPLTLVVAPTGELNDALLNLTSSLAQRLSKRRPVKVAIVGVQQLFSLREFSQLSPQSKARRARAKFLAPVVAAHHEPLPEMLILTESKETSEIHDLEDFKDSLEASGSTFWLSDDHGQAEKEGAMVSPVAEIRVSPSSGVPIDWDGHNWDLDAKRMDLAHSEASPTPLTLVISEPPGKVVTVTTRWADRREVFTTVSTEVWQLSPSWKPLSEADEQIVNSWLRNESFRCPFGDHEHPAGTPTCKRDQKALLGQLVLQSIRAQAVGAGVILLRRRDAFEWSYLRRGIVPLGDDELLIRSEGRVSRKRREPDGTWANDSATEPSSFEAIGGECYAVYA